jgi:O-antigen/teichoic acid export membrane protein
LARSAALRDVSKLLLGNVVAKALGTASLMLFARLLSKDQLAIFPAFLMLVGLANLFLSLGIYQYFLRTLPLLFQNDWQEARRLIATGATVIVGGTIPVVLVAIYFRLAVATYMFDDPRKSWIVIYAGVGSIPYAISKIVEFIMWARGQYTQTSIVQIAESVVRPVFTIILYAAMGYTGIVVGLVAAQFVIAALSVFYARDIFPGGIPARFPLRRLFLQSMPYYLESYLWYIRGDGDTLLVSVFMGPSFLAAYYVAKTLLTNLLVLWTSVDKVAAERLARSGYHDINFGDRVRQLHSVLSQVVAPGILLLVALAPYGIVLVAGPKYLSSATPAALLLMVGFVQFQTIALDRALFVAGSPMVRLTKTAIESGISLASALLLAHPLGLTGIALARVFGPCGGALYSLFMLGRRFAIRLPFRDLALTLATTAAPTLLIVLLAPSPKNSGAAIVYGAISATIWLVLFFAISYFVNRAFFDLCLNWLRTQLAPLKGHWMVHGKTWCGRPERFRDK